MREINVIVVHCSDSDNDYHDDIKVIDRWHKERGFKKVGYHYFIKKDGTIQRGRHDDEIGAHVKGYNKNSLGICLSGKKEFTSKQFFSLKMLIDSLILEYNLELKDIVGHKELDKNKTCPNFNVHEKLFKEKQ